MCAVKVEIGVFVFAEGLQILVRNLAALVFFGVIFYDSSADGY